MKGNWLTANKCMYVCKLHLLALLQRIRSHSVIIVLYCVMYCCDIGYWHQGASMKTILPLLSGIWWWMKKGRGRCFEFPSVL